MNLYGLFRVYSATFFVFSDYLKPSARIAALQEFHNTLFGHMTLLVLVKMDQHTNQLSIYHNLELYQTSIHSDQQMQLKM